jgi:hypothetical protein
MAGNAELEPGQSPAGGSGEGQQGQQPNNIGGEYSDADFFQDLVADGIIDGKAQERGAEKPEQSDKGSEPGAEPHKVEPTEPQLIKDGEPKTEDAPAQVPPEAELTPEERWRREAQSAKDQLYAERQEKQKLLEQQTTRQQADFEAQIEAQHQVKTAPQAELCNGLLELYNAAVEEENSALAQRLYVQWNQAKATLDVMNWEHARTKEQQKQSKVEQARQTHLTVVDRQLKEDFDTSLDELKKFKPDLNPYDPFSLQKAVALIHKDRVKTAEEKGTKEGQKFRDEARTVWGAKDPGSQPDRATTANGAGKGSGLPDYSGMSETAILEDVLSEIVKSGRR